MVYWPLAVCICVIKRVHENSYMWDMKNVNYKLTEHKKCFYTDLKNELFIFFPKFPVTEGKNQFLKNLKNC